METTLEGEIERFEVKVASEIELDNLKVKYPILKDVILVSEPRQAMHDEGIVRPGAEIRSQCAEDNVLRLQEPGTLGFFCSGDDVHYAITARHVLTSLGCLDARNALVMSPAVSDMQFSGCSSDLARDIAWLTVKSGQPSCSIANLNCNSYGQASDCSPYHPDAIDWDAIARLIRNADIVHAYKTGAVTGKTTGRLRSVTVYTQQGHPKVEVAWLQQAFTANGDSGSLYWIECQGHFVPLAVHQRGDGQALSAGLRIDAVFEASPDPEDTSFCEPTCEGLAGAVTVVVPAAAKPIAAP